MSDQLIDKLDAVNLNISTPASEYSYDYVEESADTMEHPVEPTLAINTATEWQKTVLKDPKVC